MRRLTLFLTLALVATSCGDDGGGGTTSASETETTTTASTTSADADAEEPPTEDSTPSADIVLTDSFRGVTADTITLGYTSVDFDLLNSTFGLDYPYADSGPLADAIADWYNANGGVLGRNIELIHESYLPVGPTSADEVCVKLTEDSTVFAILGGFSGPGAVDVNDCITEKHDTILVGSAPRAEQAERAGGLWVSVDMGLERRYAALATLLSDAGVLDELGPMIVIGSTPAEQPLVDVMAAALVDAGVEVPVTEVVTTTGDRQATTADVGLWVEKARIAGVTTAVLLGEDVYRNEDFFSLAPEFTYIMGAESLAVWQNSPPDGLQAGTRVLSTINAPEEALFEDPRILECIDHVEEAIGIEVLPTSELADGEINYSSGAIGACRNLSLFTQIAEAAGPDLTNDSWIAALDKVPDLTLPGYDFVSLNSGKVDARDQLVLVEYDYDSLSFPAISDPVDVG